MSLQDYESNQRLQNLSRADFPDGGLRRARPRNEVAITLRDGLDGVWS